MFNYDLITTILVFNYLVGTVITIIGFWFFIECIYYIIKNRTPRKVLATIGFLVIGLLFMFGSLTLSKTFAERRYVEAIQNDYTFYMEGEKINPETVERSSYVCKYDDDAHTVKMTKRKNNPIFFFIPILH